ncbi:hypothetical protein CC1G_03557 [Coprinopsis cinerea okayama7|uniref:Sec20 C-terminal domain-containing protein n=1 Tax=Coprinopsis cinerea (strain Okayama-7 / 130 / ATCC MYA-4618 / FGSC 9003) TaxID=240176 RepID=A8NCJ9_COPC7|nr:hypothetical protein CC1G_03557 [Coprinopsis cinerea okayama7\|eukprot:XP_001832543.1 hypothetical protein CC1G_03557 [Coprinopsis cinerea okayama7\
MPPLPTKFSEEAQDLITNLERRQSHLVNSQIPELRDCKGPLTLQQSLADELREDLVVFSRHVENLDAMVDDQKGERTRRELSKVVEEFRSSLQDLRAKTRSAVLTSKKTIDALQRSRRNELLFQPSTPDSEKQPTNEKYRYTLPPSDPHFLPNNPNSSDTVEAAQSSLTAAMQRTLTSLQAELERSVLTNQLLQSSTASLQATSNQHDSLNTAILTTRTIVTALEKSDWLDRVLILSAFGFFLLVVLFIVKQRVVDRGVGMVLWWFKWIPGIGYSTSSVMAGSGVDLEKGVKAAASTVSTATSLGSVIASSVVAAASSAMSTQSSSVDSSSLPSEPSDTTISSTLSIAVSTASEEDTPRTTSTINHEEL